MKVMVVGGTGTIGQAVVKELAQRHQVVTVGHEHGDFQVDIADSTAIAAMYQQIGKIDAVVVTTGKVAFSQLNTMTEKQYWIGLQSKLMGQVNLVLQGLDYLNDHGSFTLTSGIINHSPIRAGSSAAMVNGAIDSFVRAAAIELPRGLRINAVSPTVLLESMGRYGDYFHGYQPVPAAEVALAYSKSVNGLQTGQVYRAGWC